MSGRPLARAALIALALAFVGCKKSEASFEESSRPAPPPPPPPPEFPMVAPPSPAAPQPVAQGDAGVVIENALERAKEFHAKGQSAIARLVLERKALGPTGTAAEREFLAMLCREDGDAACVEQALGKSADAGAHKKPAPKKVP